MGRLRRNLIASMVIATGSSPIANAENCAPGIEMEVAVDYATDLFPSVCQAHDLDGDGHIDIVSSNRDSATVRVFWNNGAGEFPTSLSLPTGPSPRGVAIADLDGDLIPDLAIANTEVGVSTVSVILNNGDRTFALFYSVTSGLRPRLIEAGDINNDGKMDLVTADRDGNSMSVMMNMGSGAFESPATYPAGSVTGSVSLGYFNDDTWLDVVVGNRFDYEIEVFMNNGDGSFGAGVTYPAPEFPRDHTVADFDEDGDQDIAVAFGLTTEATETHITKIYSNNGDGTFSVTATMASGVLPHSITHGDLNCDGHIDLVVGSIGLIRIQSVLLGDGTGSFAEAVDFPVGGSGTYNAVADLDGDGLLDIINAGQSTNMISVLINATPLCEVPADVSNDCAVGAADIAALIGAWGPCAAAPAECRADLDGDGVVGSIDLAQLVGQWGLGCE